MLKFDCFIFKFMFKINLYSDTIFGLYYNVAIGNEIKNKKDFDCDTRNWETERKVIKL